MKNLTEFLKKAIVYDRTVQNAYPQLYRTFDKIEVMIQQAWVLWEDEITAPYWNGKEKGEEPTESFSEFWLENEDFEADNFDLETLKEILK